MNHQPQLRGRLGAAWDLGFQWLNAGPGTHHAAVPYSVLAAFVTLSMCWGWPRVGALAAIGWTALLRPGEFIRAERRHLVLPCDDCFSYGSAIIAIEIPKTRFTGAKVQSSYVDAPDLVALLSALYPDSPPEAKLWPASQRVYRERVKALAAHMCLPTVRGKRNTGVDMIVDPAGLRGGGATHLLRCTRDPFWEFASSLPHAASL